MAMQENFNLITLAKYWPDLTPEERHGFLAESQLIEEIKGVSLSDGNFRVIVEALHTAGVSPDDGRFSKLALLVSETATRRCPRCPCCGCSLIVVPEEGSFCSTCEWFEGDENLQGQLDDAWR
jgi:hypothetical protein